MKKTTILALLFWALVASTMLLDMFLPLTVVNSVSYSFSTMIIILLILFAWFIADAAEIGFNPSFGLKVGVALLALIAIPYYRIKHTGLKSASLFSVKVIGIYFCNVFIFLILHSVIGNDALV